MAVGSEQKPRRGAIGWIGLLVVSGCAIALQKSQVSRRFHAIFGCPPDQSTVFGTAGGYRAEGCGRVAHFRCFDTDGDSDEDYDEGGVIGALVGSMVTGAFDRETCILEHSESYNPGRSPRPGSPSVRAVKRETMELTLKARVLVAGGHLRLLAKPAKHPEHLLLTVHRVARLSPAPCSAELFMDGVAVPIPEVKRVSDHEVRLLVRAQDLRDADRAVRLSGGVCGFEFELDEHGRETVGLFEARLREEVARRRALLTSGAEVTPTTPVD